MFYHHLHTWLTKTSFAEENVKELTELQVKHVKELVELRGDPIYVPSVLLHSAIEVSHIEGGADRLISFANHLRTTADTIDRRVRKHQIRTVSTMGEPVNQG